MKNICHNFYRKIIFNASGLWVSKLIISGKETNKNSMLTENLWRCFTSNTFDFFLYRLAYFRFESNNNNWSLGRIYMMK